MSEFADDWITTGWSHGPDGKWIELGHSAAAKSYPPAELPELPVHTVSAYLDACDRQRIALEEIRAERSRDHEARRVAEVQCAGWKKIAEELRAELKEKTNV